MMTLKLALRNLLGAGMKTWLRVGVLSLAFVTIIALQGLYEGMNLQATEAMIAAELGGGQVPGTRNTIRRIRSTFPTPMGRCLRSSVSLSRAERPSPSSPFRASCTPVAVSVRCC